MVMVLPFLRKSPFKYHSKVAVVSARVAMALKVTVSPGQMVSFGIAVMVTEVVGQLANTKPGRVKVSPGTNTATSPEAPAPTTAFILRGLTT